jgi:hypothetical protein
VEKKFPNEKKPATFVVPKYMETSKNPTTIFPTIAPTSENQEFEIQNTFLY